MQCNLKLAGRAVLFLVEVFIFWKMSVDPWQQIAYPQEKGLDVLTALSMSMGLAE